MLKFSGTDDIQRSEIIMPTREKKTTISRLASIAKRILIAVIGVLVFIYGIQLLKHSAGLLIVGLESFFSYVSRSPYGILGFGWLAAYAVMSGSPIAAFGLGLFDLDIIDSTSTFFLIMGSRLGAAFIVIIIGLVAMMRGGGREESLSMGVLSFLVTYLVYIPAIFVGYLMLVSNEFSFLSFDCPEWLTSGIESVFGPLIAATISTLNGPLSFLLALGALYLGLAVFDKAFHREEKEELTSSQFRRLLSIPAFSFLIGAGITFVSTSVSLSLGMLVPLYLKGYIRRRQVVPYIMGANVTTFVDTLGVAIVLGDAAAINIVMINIVSVLLVSIVCLLLYKYVFGFVFWLYNLIFESRFGLVVFILVLFAFPVGLLLA